MEDPLELSSPEEARRHLIVEIGLDSSAMKRNFVEGSMKTLREKLLAELLGILSADEEQYKTIHSSFCKWGASHIMQAERRKNGRIIKRSAPTSYGQIAKTLDVALKVIVYYCHLPDCERSQLISKWLNAAVDTQMMAWLKKQYPEDAKSWPITLEGVDDLIYASIQKTVRKSIDERPGDRITPVQFDDMLWKKLNRPD